MRGILDCVVFSDDGRDIHVENYNDRNVQHLCADGNQIMNKGKSLFLPGQLGLMRGKTQF